MRVEILDSPSLLFNTPTLIQNLNRQDISRHGTSIGYASTILLVHHIIGHVLLRLDI